MFHVCIARGLTSPESRAMQHDVHEYISQVGKKRESTS